MSPKWIITSAVLCALSAPTASLASQAVSASGEALVDTDPEARTLSVSAEIGGDILAFPIPASPELMLLRPTASGEASVTAAAVTGVNTLALTQDGSNNEAQLLQAGTDNVMELRQTGDANDATLFQRGHGLRLAVDQAGGAVVTVTQINR